MYKQQFDKLDKRFSSYLFWGEEPYYIKKYGQKIADTIDAAENKMVLYYDDYDYETAKNYLSQASLFGDTNLLIIKRDKALPKKELTELLTIAQKMDNSFIIYECYSNDGKKIESLFSDKNDAVHVRFFKPSMAEARRELLQLAQQKGITIDGVSLEHLLMLLEGNLDLAASELEKLRLVEGSVEPKDIDSLVYALNPLNLEKFYIALIQKEPVGELFAKLIEEEHNETKILLGLTGFLQQLFMFHTHIRLYGKADSKAVLGYKLPVHVEKQRVALALRIKNYPAIFMLLQECELMLKTKTHSDKSGLLFSYLIKLQALF